MKVVLFSVILFSLTKFSSAENYSIVGAWLWNDSKEKVSIFIKPNGIIQMYSGKNGDVMLTKDLKNGKFQYEKDILTITWLDNSIVKL